MEIFLGEAIFPKIRTHWGKGRDQEMSSLFHFPKLWRHPSQTSGLSHPFPVRYHSCRKTEKAFIPCLKVQACFFLRTSDSNICPVSMARVDTDQLFPRTKGSSRKGKGGPPPKHQQLASTTHFLKCRCIQTKRRGAICGLPVARNGDTQETA